jgi:putative transposase
MDLFSRRIVGWSAASMIHRELVLDAVLMAVRSATTEGDPDSFGSRHPVRERCLAPLLPIPSHGAEHEPKGQLLGQRQSFFSSLKKERIKKHIYKNRELRRFKA